MIEAYPRRTATAALAILIGATGVACNSPASSPPVNSERPASTAPNDKNHVQMSTTEALKDLSMLAIKGRAPKTGYSREQFGNGWGSKQGCDTREAILRRDLVQQKLDAKNCNVVTGVLDDPYTGKQIMFTRGRTTSAAVQIDHVVALGDAWQTGAQQLPKPRRMQLANDPLELLAADGPSNEQKGDSDAASWLPANKAYRCTYVAKQILVKEKYELWVTPAEHDAMADVLSTCPDEILYVSD